MTIALHVLLVGGFALVLSLALAPMESLGWWAGWLGPDPEDPPPPPPAADAGDAPPACFVVFLSGIGSISGDELLPALLNVRNLFQVLVSADHRYGPLYSFGIARVARERLEAHGYRPESRTPVVLLGSSGGGQISVGAATFLGAELDAPLAIVTFGGVMASDRGIEEVTRLASLYGTDDKVYRLGRTIFPGRWPLASASFWNVARSEHRLSERAIGPMGHSGRGGYLDAAPRADGAPLLERTVGAVAAAVRDVLSAQPPGPGSRPSISSTSTG